ncbi:MAG: dienelactone hydrolase family protein [Myxococcales bacterium]|nr:dienelactone hydrolase family protein [Myxococcales bacterium]
MIPALRRSLVALLATLSLLACDRTPPEPLAPPRTSASVPPERAPTPPGPLEAGGVEYLVRYRGGAQPEERLPMVVAIHGLGDRPDRFGLLEGFPAPLRVIVPRGLSPHGGGYSWFPIRVRDADPVAVAQGMEVAVDALGKMIAGVVERYPTIGKPIVTGFSQGGMLSFGLAVLRPTQIAAAVPVAGWLPEPLWQAPPSESAPPIVALHGDADPVLPVGPTRDAVAALRERGWKVDLVEYPGVEHRIPTQVRRELFRQLAQFRSGLIEPVAPHPAVDGGP